MKCLPRAKIPQAAGCVLHDWHAEIIAMRAFNRFLLEECLLLAQNPGELESSCLIRPRDFAEISETSETGGFQPFTIRENVKIYMYCSEAPCGDASMELVMQAQDDPTPWPIDSLSLESKHLKGRAHFSVLGIVRRKPCMNFLHPFETLQQ